MAKTSPTLHPQEALSSSDVSEQTSASIAQLRDIHARLARGDRLTDAQRELLTNAIANYLNAHETGSSPSLDRAMGLRTWGGLSPSRSDALDVRNRSIVRLWKVVPEWQGVHPVAASRLMRQSAEKYYRNCWPRDRASLTAPTSEPAATWWKILHSNLKIPGDKQLQNILNDANR